MGRIHLASFSLTGVSLCVAPPSIVWSRLQRNASVGCWRQDWSCSNWIGWSRLSSWCTADQSCDYIESSLWCRPRSKRPGKVSWQEMWRTVEPDICYDGPVNAPGNSLAGDCANHLLDIYLSLILRAAIGHQASRSVSLYSIRFSHVIGVGTMFAWRLESTHRLSCYAGGTKPSVKPICDLAWLELEVGR